jgi:molybdopterin converting factor small subunit
MKVKIPSPLEDYTRASVVQAQGHTLAELLDDLERQFKGIRFRMIDEQDRIRAHIKIFVNKQWVKALDVPLTEDSEVMIVAALSGG